MTSQLQTGIVEKKPEVILAGARTPLRAGGDRRLGRPGRLKAKPGRGTLAQEKPPIFGMIQ